LLTTPKQEFFQRENSMTKPKSKKYDFAELQLLYSYLKDHWFDLRILGWAFTYLPLFVAFVCSVLPVLGTAVLMLGDFIACFYASDVIGYDAVGTIIVIANKNCTLLREFASVANRTMFGLNW
jgi:hypothetical protein